MADNSKLVLPGEFEKGKNYLIKGETMIAWRDSLLADRVVPGPNLTESQTPQGRILSAQAGGQRSSPPWEPAENGDETINISPGSVLGLGDGNLTLREVAHYAGGDIEVTGTGFIYGTIEAAMSMDPIINIDPTFGITDSAGDTANGSVNVTIMRLFPVDSGPISVQFGGSLPSSPTDFAWEIAKVELVAGVAKIVRRILFQNPILNSILEPPG